MKQTESEINRNESFYSQISKFSMRRKTVYSLIKTYKALTTHEIKDKMRLEKHQVSGRVTELAELFFIKPLGSKLNDKTDKMNTIWVLTTPEERTDLVASELSELKNEREILESDLAWLVLSKTAKNLITDRINKLNELINKLEL